MGWVADDVGAAGDGPGPDAKRRRTGVSADAADCGANVHVGHYTSRGDADDGDDLRNILCSTWRARQLVPLGDAPSFTIDICGPHRSINK